MNSFWFRYLAGSLFLVFQLASTCLDYAELGLLCHGVFPPGKVQKRGKERYIIENERIECMDINVEK